MRRTVILMLLIVATAAEVKAQAPRKKACDLLSTADVEAVFGVSPLRAHDPSKVGEDCVFEKVVNQGVFSISINYADAPDPDAVVKWLKSLETNTYYTARPAAGIGDAAYYTMFSTDPKPRGLVVFVAGKVLVGFTAGTPDQLRALAEKALSAIGRTGFAYNGAVPTTTKPVAPPPSNATSSSPLDNLKSTLTKKADAGDVRAEEALAGLYRFPSTGTISASPSDYAAAMYWYKRASDHGVARASYQLGTMYHEGIGGPVNDDAAKELFTKAADAGYVPAMMPLAFIYAASSDFVSKRRAAEWALKAAAGNDPEGHLTAGYLWEKGQLSFDDSESGRNALAEYRKAADEGNCIAMMNIGGLYFNGGHGLRQDAAQAEQWFARAHSCFGSGVEDMRQKAARYRSLAAAGRLPVPQPPPAPAAGSRFFNRPGSASQQFTALEKIAADMLAMAALSAAYLIEHPEVANQLSSGGSGSGGSGADDYNDLQNRIHNVEVQRNIWSGACKPPVGCY